MDEKRYEETEGALLYEPDEGPKRWKTEQYLEWVLGEDHVTTIGWRFWIFAKDPRFNFGTGIQHLIERNVQEAKNCAKRREKVSPPTPDALWRGVNAKAIWATDLCDTYLHPLYEANRRGAPRCRDAKDAVAPDQLCASSRKGQPDFDAAASACAAFLREARLARGQGRDPDYAALVPSFSDVEPDWRAAGVSWDDSGAIHLADYGT